MKKFPMPFLKGGANGKLIILSDEQKEWFKRYYPVTENKVLAKKMSVSQETVRRFRNELSLSKSEEGKRIIAQLRAERAKRTCEKNGVFDRKRGKPVSAATMAGNKLRWQKVRDGIIDDPITVLRKNNPQGYEDMLARKRKERKEMIRREKMRILYGLERKTKIKSVVMCPYTQSQTHHRCAALKRGYLLDVDCSEGTEGRYTIYYDDDTMRSAKFEDNCRKDGFSFARDEV